MVEMATMKFGEAKGMTLLKVTATTKVQIWSMLYEVALEMISSMVEPIRT